MKQLVDELSSRYPDRVIVLDCPPMLGINETSIILDYCGQALIVVREDETSFEMIDRVEELLPDEIIKGFVLNRSRSTSTAYGYGYGYGQSE